MLLHEVGAAWQRPIMPQFELRKESKSVRRRTREASAAQRLRPSRLIALLTGVCLSLLLPVLRFPRPASFPKRPSRSVARAHWLELLGADKVGTAASQGQWRAANGRIDHRFKIQEKGRGNRLRSLESSGAWRVTSGSTNHQFIFPTKARGSKLNVWRPGSHAASYRLPARSALKSEHWRAPAGVPFCLPGARWYPSAGPPLNSIMRKTTVSGLVTMDSSFDDKPTVNSQDELAVARFEAAAWVEALASASRKCGRIFLRRDRHGS